MEGKGKVKKVVPVSGYLGLAFDLFCGAFSVGTQLEKCGFKVISLDCQPSAKAEITIEVLE